MEMGLRCCLVQKVPYLIRNPTPLDLESSHQSTWNTTRLGLNIGGQKLTQCRVSFGNPHMQHISRRARRVPVSVKESSSVESENNYTAEDPVAKTLSVDELKAWSANSERASLLRKLSEANQQNRFLKRQLHIREEALVDFKNELADMELDIQASVKLSVELANSAIPEGTRKINGKYIQSHLLSRLEGVLEKLRAQIKDVAVTQSKEVLVSWYGMAESVQVMGTFDGWSQGEYLSPEYMGAYNKFSATLLLRPGRYEIKFLVDGEWKLSPEFPSVGEGLTENNLLVVE